MRRHANGETGSSTVHALTAAVLAIVVATVAWQTIALVRLRHQVASAADLAALAGSRAASEGRDGCAAARSLADLNHARLTSCRSDVAVVTVGASASATTLWGGRWTARARARAAPADYVDP